MSKTDEMHAIIDSYTLNVSQEVLHYGVTLNINYEDGRTRSVRVQVSDCRLAANLFVREPDVRYVTVGCCRNYVTIHKTGVSSVIFYDCFFLPPEERTGVIEKAAYDYVCAEFLMSADVHATTYDEYIACVNSDAFEKAFDARNRVNRLDEFQ